MRGLATVKGWMPAEEARDEHWCTGGNLWSITFHDQRDLKDPVTMETLRGESIQDHLINTTNRESFPAVFKEMWWQRSQRDTVLLVLETKRGGHRPRHAGGRLKLVKQGHTSPRDPPKRNGALLIPDCSPVRPMLRPREIQETWAIVSHYICSDLLQQQ